MVAIYFILKLMAANKQHRCTIFVNTLQCIAAIFTILGITIISIFGPIINKIPSKQIRDAESKMEQIGLRQSKEYIDNLIGPAKSYTEIDLQNIDGTIQKGSKSVYESKYYLLICYYRNDNSLLGYFLISKDKKFKPKETDETLIHIIGDENLFYDRIKDKFCSVTARRGFLVMIAYRLQPFRADGSGYYMEYHYHHFSTRNIYYGIGFSEFGYSDAPSYLWKYNPQKTIRKNNSLYELFRHGGFNTIKADNDITDVVYNNLSNEGEEPFLEYLDSTDIDSTYDLLSYGKINTISLFEKDEKINLIKLLESELYNKMALTRVEYSYLR